MGNKVYSAKGQSSSGATTSVGDASSTSQNFSAVSQRVEMLDGGAINASFGFADTFSDKLLSATEKAIGGVQSFARDSMSAAVEGARELRDQADPQAAQMQQMMLFALAVVAGIAIWRR